MAKVRLQIDGKDNASASIKGVTSSIINANIAFQGLKMAAGFVTDVIKQSIEGFIKQEDAVVSLQAAVGGSTKELEAFASEMQRTANVGDEAVLEIMKLAKTMGVSKDNLDEAAKGAIGLSEAFGIDLNTSVKMFAQTQQGQFTMLQRYIPELKNATTKSDKLALVNRKVAEGFEIAQAKTNTFGGAIKAFQNSSGDLLEVFGQLIASVGKDMVKAMTDMTNKIIDFLKSEKGIKIMSETFATLATVIAIVVNAIKIFVDWIATAIRIVKTFGGVLAAVFSGDMKKAAEEIKKVGNELKNFTDRTVDTVKKTANVYDDVTNKIKDAFKSVEVDAKGSNTAIAESTEQTVKKISESWKSLQSATSSVFGSLQGISDQYYANEIANAEGNEAKQKQLKRSQFESNKALAVTNSIINTASAVIAALNPVTYPPPFNFIMSGIIGGLGAVQTGLIMAQPMPSFAQGGIAPGGMALVGERGPEVVDLPAGSRVYNNQESRAMMGISINGPITIKADNVETIVKQMRRIARIEAARA